MMKDNQKVKNFIKTHKLENSLNAKILDLQSEFGEFCKEVLVSTSYGSEDLELTNEMISELGDVYYSLLTIFVELDLNPSDCLDSTLKKYLLRMQSGNNPGSIETD